jgi:hypothetical protein
MCSNTVEVFRTTIQTKRKANKILKILHTFFPAAKITIDLTDCDRVLRIEGENLTPTEIVRVVTDAGFTCMILD